MALNFTVSYTFSPGTTISSSQVNTNTSDVAAVFQGLEAETKTLAKLKVDVDPTVALEVATKQYVDHYSALRRPRLTFGSITTIIVEAGLDGTSGHIPILFPDGTLRTETTSTRTTFDITRNAVLVTSGAQSGLTGATSEATNTWYALYAVKVTDSSTLWVTVGTTVLPLLANFSTLNTAYGTNGWIYLGMVRNGDASGASGDLLTFSMSGQMTMFKNACTGTVVNHPGTRLATANATGVTYTVTNGTGTTDIPNHFGFVCLYWAHNNADSIAVRDAGSARAYAFLSTGTGGRTGGNLWIPASDGLAVSGGNAVDNDIALIGFMDTVLGIGSNPLL